MVNYTYAISGFTIRGFFVHKRHWTPRSGQLLDCVISQKGAVKVVKGKSVNGSVPTELQEVSRNFLKAGGDIKAQVLQVTPVNGPNGEEIRCKYIWSYGSNKTKTALVKTAVSVAREAVAKLRKKANNKKISFKKVNEAKKNNLRKRSTGNVDAATDKTFSKKKSTVQHRDMGKSVVKNGNLGGPCTSTITSDDLPVGNNIPTEEKIPLTSKDLAKIAQCINVNWELLAAELELNDTEVWQIQTDNKGAEVIIYKVLQKWKEIKADEACLQSFKRAVAECPKVGFEQPKLNNLMLKIAKDYKEEKSKLN
ncbi:uncharacterized protein LOC123535218 isoform X2 [Mercenaria mercenaria]|uniref:uncharacterized protein LOC123535218 isoform X2 n=1 Tax=Mercenaria mercenaria TaxID=6596 RepID=UPI00234F4271|nr:uncharacterized protein LOC123535218 isoform X2 [Mercenaria mercenaria]